MNRCGGANIQPRPGRSITEIQTSERRETETRPVPRQLPRPSALRPPAPRGGGIPTPASSRPSSPQACIPGCALPETRTLLQQPRSGLRPPGSASGLRPPTSASGLRPPGGGLRPPTAGGGLRPPTGGGGLRPPTGGGGLRPPAGGGGLRPPAGGGGLRPPAGGGGLRPTQMRETSGMRPQDQSYTCTARNRPQSPCPAQRSDTAQQSAGLRPPASAGLRSAASAGAARRPTPGMRPPASAGYRAPSSMQNFGSGIRRGIDTSSVASSMGARPRAPPQVQSTCPGSSQNSPAPCSQGRPPPRPQPCPGLRTPGPGLKPPGYGPRPPTPGAALRMPRPCPASGPPIRSPRIDQAPPAIAIPLEEPPAPCTPVTHISPPQLGRKTKGACQGGYSDDEEEMIPVPVASQPGTAPRDIMIPASVVKCPHDTIVAVPKPSMEPVDLEPMVENVRAQLDMQEAEERMNVLSNLDEMQNFRRNFIMNSLPAPVEDDDDDEDNYEQKTTKEYFEKRIEKFEECEPQNLFDEICDYDLEDRFNIERMQQPYLVENEVEDGEVLENFFCNAPCNQSEELMRHDPDPNQYSEELFRLVKF